MNYHTSPKTIFVALILLMAYSNNVSAQEQYVTFQKEKGSISLSEAGKASPLYMSKEDLPGAIRAFKDLQADIYRVTQVQPLLFTDKAPSGKEVVIAGTIGHSTLIDQLIKTKKIDVSNIKGKWETFLIQVIEKPMPNVDRALIIAGSDMRGTIFGIYDLSKQIGVSPWYWWADVPTKKNTSLYVLPGSHIQGEPSIKYRGIFLNDEEPALGRWAVEKFGGFNHQFYEKLFELMLRLKANYLWPAMWWASFNSDDALNPKFANEYGIVMGTSHHEPMNRAHAEWKAANGGEWNYETNELKLKEFWTEGIKRMDSYETIVSLAMRGDGDKAMSEDTNVALLERIVKDQREIISNVTKKDIKETPQLWALYKEVQDYYDKGMRVPDDVMLLLSDDNWGNIRKLPKLTDAPHPGGYGIYYHFDYVGGPRNYKWLNTNTLPKIWEQMHLAYRHGATKMWLVNVGDLKPMEFPTEFFLDYAWNAELWNQNNLDKYTQQWAERQFGSAYAKEIAGILAKYTKFNARRKPESLNSGTYSLINYREAETVVADYTKIEEEAEQIYKAIATEYKDAYYQLILHTVRACANLNKMYLAVAKNHLYAKQGRAATNDFAEQVKILFDQDSAYSYYYNKELAGGKWNHMMDQTHISYTYWQQPQKDVIPKVDKIDIPTAADMGVFIEGSDSWWPNEKTEATLPEFDAYNQQTYYVEAFNRGMNSFSYTIQSSAPWIKISQDKGEIEKQQRIFVSVDWSKAPKGKNIAAISITSSDGKKVPVNVAINNPVSPKRDQLSGFVEGNGYISMEAVHYTKAVNSTEISWKPIPDLGRTLSAMTTFPVTAQMQAPSEKSPHLEFEVYTLDSGAVNVLTYVSPTIDFHNGGGLKYAVAIDNEPPQVMNIHSDNSNRAWEKSVADNIIITTSKHILPTKEKHVLKFWMVDPGIIIQKLVIDMGGVKPSYLGPPESYFTKPTK